MKKILAVLAAFVAAASLSVSAFAAEVDVNEQAIIDYLGSVTINGAPLADSLINEATSYFAEDGVSVTSTQLSAFLANVDEIVAICEANGVTAGEDGVINIVDLKGTSADVKAEIIDNATELASNLGLTFIYSAVSKSASLYDANGNKVRIIRADEIKDTGFGGFEGVVTATGVMLGLVAVSAVVAKKRKLAK